MDRARGGRCAGGRLRHQQPGAHAVAAAALIAALRELVAVVRIDGESVFGIAGQPCDGVPGQRVRVGRSAADGRDARLRIGRGVWPVEPGCRAGTRRAGA